MREWLGEINPEMLLADGFEDALIGYVERFGQLPLALYDREKCIEVLMKRDGMNHQDAEEFFEYNVIGAWLGDNTPAFATLRKPDEL
jgi:hypothetical protein